MSEKTDIALEAGRYENFTGVIMWGDNEAVVKDAFFRLDNTNSGFKYVIFHSGIWKNGIWKDGVWEGGTWENGVWHYGTWKDGTWKDGTWKDGIWENGSWKSGLWENGIWKTGYDRNECTRIVSPNNWEK